MLKSSLITPYRGERYHLKEYSRNPPRNARELFNLRHSSLRNAIERTFGVVKKRFAIIRSSTEPHYGIETQKQIILCYCILHNYLINADPDEGLLAEVDVELNNNSEHQEENHSNRDDSDDARRGEFLRDSMVATMWMRKKDLQNASASKANNQCIWTKVMDDALIDAYLNKHNIGNRVAVEWKTKPVRNYEKLVQLYGKDRATGQYAETASEMRKRKASIEVENNVGGHNFETIDEVEFMISQQEIHLDNEDAVNMGAQIPTQPSKSQADSFVGSSSKKKSAKKGKVDDENISNAIDHVAQAIMSSTHEMVKSNELPIPEHEVWTGSVDKFLEWVAFPGELMLVEGRIRPKARICAIRGRQSLRQVMPVLVLALVLVTLIEAYREQKNVEGLRFVPASWLTEISEFCTAGLPSDLTVEVREMSFHLHKLHDIPGGIKAFELVAKFCYGVKLELTASNVVYLRCAAEHLQMTEKIAEGNSIAQTEIFFNQVALCALEEGRMRLSELEKECTSMRQDIEKLGKGRRVLIGVQKKLGFRIKSQLCGAKRESVRDHQKGDKKTEKFSTKNTRQRNQAAADPWTCTGSG
ncbi:hypothetical protein ZIOFF_072167 [Zingiber officinale]|uniref:DDE Tnp4 domain-containing protein n=1 Tax=Zingiber officinale TaxID=94328 RepID=A0A8J5BFB1_ZINOF|nr:hypothetical protein ZIOFF_072167 [Zingiber officinale]